MACDVYKGQEICVQNFGRKSRRDGHSSTSRSTQLLYQLLNIYKIYTLKTLRHVSVLGPSSGSHIVIAKVTLILLYQLDMLM